MPRKKRSDKLAEAAVIVEPAPAPELPKVTEMVVAALCPVCGHSLPEKRAIKIGSITADHIGYFDSIDWDENKPFGVTYTAGGRGSFREWHHINPEHAPELFQALKARFLQALREWVDKGWISPDEIEAH